MAHADDLKKSNEIEVVFKYMKIYVYTYLFIMTELRKCSRCRSEIELKKLASTRKGEYDKTCVNCLDEAKRIKLKKLNAKGVERSGVEVVFQYTGDGISA